LGPLSITINRLGITPWCRGLPKVGTAKGKQSQTGKGSGHQNPTRKGIESIPRANSTGYKQSFQLRFKNSLPSILSANVGGVGGELSFGLYDYPNVANCVSMFDYFRIDRVKVWFRPITKNVANSNSSSAIQGTPPLFCVACDTNAISVTPAGLPSNYANSKIVNADQSLMFDFKPSSLLIGYEGVGNNFYVPNTLPIRTADYNTPHYGLLYYMNQPGGANPSAGMFGYNVETEYFVTLFAQK
jgi:hypothetical protein